VSFLDGLTDWKLSIYNWFQRKVKAPLGYDIAGKAVKVGRNVTHIQEGDEVVCIVT
jgi:NADPH:quinone reductase-like Zn-dependent oxidoreductase